MIHSQQESFDKITILIIKLLSKQKTIFIKSIKENMEKIGNPHRVDYILNILYS